MNIGIVDVDECDGDESDTDSLSEAQQLQNLLNQEEDKTLSRSKKQEEELLNLTCAAMAVLADEAMIVYVWIFITPSLTDLMCDMFSQAVADETDGDAEEILAEEYCEIRDLINGLPAIQASNEPAKPIGKILTLMPWCICDAHIRHTKLPRE